MMRRDDQHRLRLYQKLKHFVTCRGCGTEFVDLEAGCSDEDASGVLHGIAVAILCTNRPTGLVEIGYQAIRAHSNGAGGTFPVPSDETCIEGMRTPPWPRSAGCAPGDDDEGLDAYEADFICEASQRAAPTATQPARHSSILMLSS